MGEKPCCDIVNIDVHVYVLDVLSRGPGVTVGPPSGCREVWFSHEFWKLEIAGSNPATLTIKIYYAKFYINKNMGG